MQSFSLALQLLAFSFSLPFSALMRLTSSSFYWSLGSPLLPVRSSWSFLIPENHYNQTVAQNSFCRLSSLPPTFKDFGNYGAASLCGLICVSCYLCELVKNNKWQRDKLMVVVWSTPGFCPPFANLQTLCPNANIGLAFVGPSGVDLVEEGLASVKPRCGAVRIPLGYCTSKEVRHVLTAVNGEPKPTDLISVRLKDFNRHFLACLPGKNAAVGYTLTYAKE